MKESRWLIREWLIGPPKKEREARGRVDGLGENKRTKYPSALMMVKSRDGERKNLRKPEG